MHKIIAIAFILFQAGSIQAAVLEVDFDGKQKAHKAVADQLKTVMSDSPAISVDEKINVSPSSKEEIPGEVKAILQVRSASGEWVTLKPESVKDGGRDSYYVYLPDGRVFRSQYTCSAGPWSVNSSFLIQPSFGGHEHSANIPPLAHTPQGAPVPPAQLSDSNLPANAWNTFTWTAPDYGARVIETATFGKCTGKITTTIDFKVRDLFPMSNGTGYVLAYGSGSHYQIHNVHELFEPKLRNIGRTWKQTCPNSAPLPYERMSLPWGGLFDLNDNWSMPAWSHDWGTTADVSKIGVNKGNRKKLIEMMCRYLSVDTEIYSEKDPSHYHIALRGVPNKTLDEASARGIGMQACCPTGTAGIPQECIDLAPGFNETLPVASDCP